MPLVAPRFAALVRRLSAVPALDEAGVFEAIVLDMRAVLRIADVRKEGSSSAIFVSQALQSTPESGGRAG